MTNRQIMIETRMDIEYIDRRMYINGRIIDAKKGGY